MKYLAPAVVLSLSLPLFAPGMAYADDGQAGKVVISSEAGVSTLGAGDVVETETSNQSVRIVKKKSGEPTTEVVLNAEKTSTTSAASATTDRKGTAISVNSLADATNDARYQAAKGDPKKIRELLTEQKRDMIQDSTIAVETLLAQKSENKAETQRLVEEKRRLEAERRVEIARAQAEQELREAAARATSSASSSKDDEEDGSETLNTDSFNLQMGDEIEGNNTTRTADGSTVEDGSVKSARGERIAREALRHIGKSYVWGGESPTAGWDCSGFVQWLYAREGVSTPRVAIDQARFAVKVEKPIPGDLVLQNNGSHIGIYLGSGKMISAWNPDRGTIVHDVDVLPYEFYRVPGVLNAAVAP